MISDSTPTTSPTDASSTPMVGEGTFSPSGTAASAAAQASGNSMNGHGPTDAGREGDAAGEAIGRSTGRAGRDGGGTLGRRRAGVGSASLGTSNGLSSARGDVNGEGDTARS